MGKNSLCYYPRCCCITCSGWDVYAGPVAEHRRTAAPFLLLDDLHVQRRAVLQLPLRLEDDSGPWCLPNTTGFNNINPHQPPRQVQAEGVQGTRQVQTMSWRCSFCFTQQDKPSPNHPLLHEGASGDRATRQARS